MVVDAAGAEDMLAIPAALPDTVDAVRPVGDRGRQIGEHRTRGIASTGPGRCRPTPRVTCADSPVRSATSRSIPTPACDTTPWPSADTFTRETAAILFTCEVPSRQHRGTVEKSHYALQDRHFRYFKPVSHQVSCKIEANR